MTGTVVELKDAVKTTIALINKDIPVLSEEEWLTCSELVIALSPFEQVTRNISGEKYLTGSQVIPLTNGLISVCSKMMKEKFQATTVTVVNELLKGLKARMNNIDSSKTIGPTFPVGCVFLFTYLSVPQKM